MEMVTASLRGALSDQLGLVEFALIAPLRRLGAKFSELPADSPKPVNEVQANMKLPNRLCDLIPSISYCRRCHCFSRSFYV